VRHAEIARPSGTAVLRTGGDLIVRGVVAGKGAAAEAGRKRQAVPRRARKRLDPDFVNATVVLWTPGASTEMTVTALAAEAKRAARPTAKYVNLDIG